MAIFNYLRAIPRLKGRPRLDPDLQREGMPLTGTITLLEAVVLIYATGTVGHHVSIIDRVMAWAWVTLTSVVFLAAWGLLIRGWINELKPLVRFARNRT
jgi:hypothetical protein